MEIDQDEYDNIKRQLGTLWTYHGVIRRMGPVVMGEEVDAQELIEVRQTYQHFIRDFSPPEEN